MLPERRVGRIEVAAGGQRAIPEELERAALRHVGAAARDDVQHAAGGLAEFRAVGVHQHLELAHRVLAEHGADAADHLVVVVEAVDGDVVGARALTGERETRALRRPLGRRAIARHAGGQQRERDVVATIDRQRGDRLFADEGRDRALARIHQRGRAGDVDVNRGRELKQQPQLGRRTDTDPYRDGRRRLISGQLGPDGVGPRRQNRYRQASRLVRDAGARQAGFVAGH